MIAVRPDARDPLPWRILREIVGAPGELRTEELADILCPVRLAPLPPGAYGAAWARLGLTPVLRDPGDLRAYRERVHGARARVARIVSRLVAQGLVEPRRELVTLSVWGAERLRVLGLMGAIEAAEAEQAEGPDELPPGGWIDGDPDDEEGPAEVDPEDPPDLTRLAAMVYVLAESPRTPRELRGSDSGAAQRAYARLAELGLICTPSHRWPTSDGAALVGRLETR